MAYGLYANNNAARPAVHVHVGAEQSASGTSTLPLNTWSHVTATYDGAAIKLYVNGALVATKAQTGSIISATGPLKIGGNAIWSEWFGGLIDEVRVYNRALSQSEIQTDMNTPVAGDTSPPTTPTGLAQTAQTETSVSFSWTASTDDVGVAGYGIYKNLLLTGTTTLTNASLTNLNCGTSYGVGVDAFDAAGNRSGQASITASTLACDITPPSAQITTPTDGATVSNTVPVSANASDNRGVVGVQFKLDGANLGAEDVTSPYSVSWNTTTAANGPHSLVAVARDAAGNTASSPTVSVTVSNGDPTPPTVALTAPAPGASVRSTIPVSATASDNVAVVGVQFKLDGANLGAEDATSPYSISWDTTLASNGSHSLTALARDAAGNTTTSTPVTVTVDNAAPATSITSPTSGQSVSGTINVNANASDNVGVAGVQFKLDGANLGAEDLTSPYSVSWNTTTAANGPHNLVAVARDAAGNTASSPTVSVTVSNGDPTPPTVALTAPAPGASVRSTIPVSATASDNVAVIGVQFKLDGANLGAEDTTSPYSISWDTTLASNGSHSLTALARDAAGNTTTSTPVTVTVDNAVPASSITSPTNGQSVSGTINVNANASDNVGVAGVQLKLDGANLGAEDTASPYSVSWSTTSVNDGTHVLTAIARDAAGNSTTSTQVTVTVNNGGGLNTQDAWVRVTIGPGIVDGSTRLVIRTPGQRIYVFSMDDSARGSGTGPSVIHAWKGNRTGIPTGFSEVDPANKPTGLQGPPFAITSPSVQLDRSGIAHMIYMDEGNDSVNYQTFSTLTDTWGPREIIATGIGVDFDGNDLYRRDATNALVLDAADVPHVVYRTGASLVYRNRTSGSWSAPELLETASIGTPRHAELAADALGNFHLSWVQSDWRQNPVPHPMIKYKKRSSSGVWGPSEIADETDVQNNDSSDQGPSIVVTQSGTPYILYINERNGSCCGSGVQTIYKEAGTGNWIPDNPPTNTFAHAPQIYSQYNDIYAFPGHDSGVNFAYRYHLAGQPWSSYIRLDGTSDTDGSGSPRWDPQRENNANVIDVAFYEENLFNDSRHIPEAYYMAVLPSGGPTDNQPPSTPTGLNATANTESSISIAWNPSTDNVGVVGYTLYRNSVAVGTTSTTSGVISQLNCGTTYTVGVDAYDQAGNHSGRSSISAATSACDSSPPSVQITSPANGANVSGVIPVDANATDNTGVAGVQFKVDGSNVGAEDTTSPYSVSWSTNSVPNGSHTLTAVARDISGNLATSAPVTVTVTNSGSPGLVASYNFDQGVGTTLPDRSGTGNNGSVSGAVWTGTGKYGGALTFDGLNDIVTVNDSASLDLTVGMTLEAWVSPAGLGNNWRTTLFKQQPGGMVYALYAHNGGGGRPAGQLNIGGERNAVGTAQLPLNLWTYLTVTYDGSALKLHVNGTQVASTTVGGAIPASTGALTMGGNPIWSEWFQGQIDNVRIYNRALSPAEIQADMNTPVG